MLLFGFHLRADRTKSPAGCSGIRSGRSCCKSPVDYSCRHSQVKVLFEFIITQLFDSTVTARRLKDFEVFNRDESERKSNTITYFNVR